MHFLCYARTTFSQRAETEINRVRLYQRILAEYREYYGVINEDDISETETLGGLKYKVEESIALGYDLLPKYYGWTNVLMNLNTKEFEEVNAQFKGHFGQSIPIEQIKTKHLSRMRLCIRCLQLLAGIIGIFSFLN